MKISGQSEFFWKIKFRISSCEIAFKITCSLLCQFSPVKQDFVEVCFFIFQTCQKLTSVHFFFFKFWKTINSFFHQLYTVDLDHRKEVAELSSAIEKLQSDLTEQERRLNEKIQEQDNLISTLQKDKIKMQVFYFYIIFVFIVYNVFMLDNFQTSHVILKYFRSH